MAPYLQAMMQGGAANARSPNTLAPTLDDLVRTMMSSTSSTASSASSASAADEEDDELTMVDMLLSVVTRQLSLPDLMALMNGDFRSLDRTEDAQYDIVVELLDQQDSEAIRNAAAEFHAESIAATFLSAEVLSARSAFARPGTDPERVAIPLLHRQLRRYFDELLTRHDRREADGSVALPPFSEWFKAWGVDFIGSVMHALVDCYTDGVTSVSAILQTAFVQRLAGVGDIGLMAPMIGGALKAGLVKVYATWTQRQGVQGNAADDAAWLERVPPAERDVWRRVIAQDEQRMRELLAAQRERHRREEDADIAEDEKGDEQSDESSRSLFKPLSYAYLSGSSKPLRVQRTQEGERTEAKEDVARYALGQSLEPTLRRVVEEVDRQVEMKQGESKVDGDGERKAGEQSRVDAVMRAVPADDGLRAAYRGQLLRDLKRKVELDDDYEAQKYPMIEKHIRKH